MKKKQKSIKYQHAERNKYMLIAHLQNVEQIPNRKIVKNPLFEIETNK